MKRWLTLIFAALMVVSVAKAEDVDLELVLAMDASGSISIPEYLLQLDGTAAAFRDPEVQAAITSGPLGKIAVAVMLWSDARFEKPNTCRHVIDSAETPEAFAAMISRFQVKEDDNVLGGGGGTGLGAGVEEALRMFAANAYRSDRQVIDVSGDGVETEFDCSKGVMIRDARALAEISGVIVNGLPISGNDVIDLASYYRDEVITGPGPGPGAFVI